jgi:hypothetical protein
MSESTKIEFRHRRVRELDDITDLVGMIFPGNRNQQHAAARILLTLRAAAESVPSLRVLEEQHGISRRTLERTRAKLARVGLIECVSPLNKRSNGQHGWKLSRRMGAALRQLADKIDEWQSDTRSERRAKDERLVGMLRSVAFVDWQSLKTVPSRRWYETRSLGALRSIHFARAAGNRCYSCAPTEK